MTLVCRHTYILYACVYYIRKFNLKWGTQFHMREARTKTWPHTPLIEVQGSLMHSLQWKVDAQRTLAWASTRQRLTVFTVRKISTSGLYIRYLISTRAPTTTSWRVTHAVGEIKKFLSWFKVWAVGEISAIWYYGCPHTHVFNVVLCLFLCQCEDFPLLTGKHYFLPHPWGINVNVKIE